jgi:hypothetical protein
MDYLQIVPKVCEVYKRIKELIVYLHLFQNNILEEKCVFAIVIYN